MPRLQKVFVESTVEENATVLSTQHVEHGPNVLLRAGEKIVVLHNPTGIDLQLSNCTLASRHDAPAAFLRTASARNRAAFLHKHARCKLAAWIIVSWAANLHVPIIMPPTLVNPLCFSFVPGERHRDSHRSFFITRPPHWRFANKRPFVGRRPLIVMRKYPDSWSHDESIAFQFDDAPRFEVRG